MILDSTLLSDKIITGNEDTVCQSLPQSKTKEGLAENLKAQGI